jgi:signal transduction histidine kinase
LSERKPPSGDGAKPLAEDNQGNGTLLALPIAVSGELYGGLLLKYPQTRIFGEEDIDLGLTFADQAALAMANDQLRAQAQQIAVETERNRLASDLHDSVTQTLFSSSLIAEALPDIWETDREEGQSLLGEIRQLSRGALAEMRNLLLELHPTVLREADLGDLLAQLVEAARGRKDIHAELDLHGQAELPTDVHVAVYRVAQEALNNVVKHAQARNVSVRLRCTNTGGSSCYAKLQVNDDGKGFDPGKLPAQCLGLGIMRERAQAIGARLTINSQAGRGTKILLEWEG